jgi:23S rRNA (cytosine1962-C5)-methyltransferase
MQFLRTRLSKAASAAVRAGHPWVLREEPARAPAGTLVELLDGKGQRVGFGLTDDGPIAVRVLSRGERVPMERWIPEAVGRADRTRLRFLDGETDAYRVVSGAGDGLDGVIVDRYGDLAVVKLYSGAWQPHLDVIVRALAALPWCRTVFRRFGVERVDGRSGGETLHGPAAPESLVIVEHGMRLLVRPHRGQKTGLFLDQREHRRWVRGWARGLQVANLFAYNGGFSVAAALGGAQRVVTVDIAADAVEDARENFRLNGLDPARHGFDVADAFDWRSEGPLGLLIIDPPSLARDRSAKEAAVRAYTRLHREHGPQVAAEGLLATSSCTARVGLGEWRAAVAEGLSRVGDWSWHQHGAEPPDHPVALGHPEAAYLKFALLMRRR